MRSRKVWAFSNALGIEFTTGVVSLVSAARVCGTGVVQCIESVRWGVEHELIALLAQFEACESLPASGAAGPAATCFFDVGTSLGGNSCLRTARCCYWDAGV